MDTSSKESCRRYQFADLTLDVGEARLWRGEQGIRLSKLTFALLRVLVQRAPNLVTQDECAQAAWGPRRIVTPENLSQRIMMLRQALGDDAAQPRYIEGVRGEGYRLVPPVRVVAAMPVAAPASRPRVQLRHIIAIAIVLCTMAGLIAYVRHSKPVREFRIVPLTFDGGWKTGPRLSPAADLVAYSWNGFTRDNPDIYVKQIGRDTQPVNVTNHPASDVGPAWSPDGNHLAFMRIDGSKAAIYIVPSLGGHARKVVDLQGPLAHRSYAFDELSWSADGRFITYAEKAKPESPARIWRIELATSDATVLTNPAVSANAVGDFSPSVSPNGKRLAFIRGQADYTNLEIWLAQADGTDARQLTTNHWANCGSLRWANNDELLFTAGDLFVERSYSLHVSAPTPRPMPGLGDNDRWVDAQGDHVVFAKVVMDSLRIWQAPTGRPEPAASRALSLIGSKLVFSPQGDRVAWQSRRTGQPQVWIANSDFGQPRPLTVQKTGAFDPRWSPDGRTIAFESADAGNADVYMVDIESGNVRTLVGDAAENKWPTFSRDGRFVYFSSDRDNAMAIYKVPVSGGPPALVSSDSGFHVTESNDGKFLYYARAVDNSLWRMSIKDGVLSKFMNVRDWNRGWVLAAGGIYYLASTEGGFSVRYRDLTTDIEKEVLRDEGRAYYLTLAPGDAAVMYSKDPEPSSELYLMENYR